MGIERLIALVIGTIPQYGNSAYALQMMYSESTHDREIGKFMLYHYLTKLGEKVPIWGGKDTRTEHFFNRIPDLIVRDRTPVYAKTQPSQ